MKQPTGESRGNNRARASNGNGKRGSHGPGPVEFSDEEMKYSAEEFLCPGQDDKGGSIRVVFRSTPVMERALEVARDSKRFPYKTVSDIIRHAVTRHLDWLHELEPTIPKHFLAALEAINEVARDSEMMTALQETFRKLDAMVDLHTSAQDDVEAMRVLSLARSQIVKVPNSKWRKLFLEKFSTKYAKHLSLKNPNSESVIETDSESETESKSEKSV